MGEGLLYRDAKRRARSACPLRRGARQRCAELREGRRFAADAEDLPETLEETIAADSTVARFVLLESLAAGGELAARHRESLRCFGERLRPQPAAPDSLGKAREQALGGGISTLLVRRLKAGEAGNLEDLLPDLHELVLTSYLGRKEAQRLARAAALRRPSFSVSDGALPSAAALCRKLFPFS